MENILLQSIESGLGVFVNYIIPAVILLGILIFVHELGHFIVAKACGVRVLKFSLGFGPKIFGKKIGDTEYLLSLLPLGGYVKPLGEALDETVADEDKPYSLNHQSIPRRFAILAAGSVFNILFATLIFTCVYMVGTPVLTTRVGQVMDESPAKIAGIMENDVIESINGQQVELWEELTGVVENSNGGELRIGIRRAAETVLVQLKPQLVKDLDILGNEVQTYRIGIAASRSEDAVITMRYNPAVSLWKGAQDTWNGVKLTVLGLAILIQSPVEKKEYIGGPILIGKIAGDFAQAGILSFVLLMAMISVNLGVLNLLPVPILDGGHIFFLCIEAVKGSPLSMRKMEIAQQAGLVLLLMLMVFVCYNDIMRFIPN